MNKLLPVLVLLGALPGAARAQEPAPDSPSILTHSPFLPPGFQPPGGAGTTTEAPASSSQYEFHGVYQLGGVYYFHLYNTRDKKGSWLGREASSADWPRITGYDEDKDSLTVEVAGEQVSLNLVETSDRSLPVVTATVQQIQPATPTATAVPPGTQQTPPRRRVIRPTVRPAEPNPAIRRPPVAPVANPPPKQ